MAVSSRSMTRQRDYSKLLIAVAVLAGVVAIAPIIAAAGGFVGSASRARTAFASAPAGEYAVIGRSEGGADVISVAWAQNPGALTEVARVPRLEGFPSAGAVSPSGRRLALATVDGGSKTHPTASLNVVDLESGKVTKAAENVVPGQAPVWAPDGTSVITTRLTGGNQAQGTLELLRAKADGSGETVLRSYEGVAGVYPVGHDSDGALVTVTIGPRGSVLERDGEEAGVLSANLTRDWRMSPDGAEIAFIEVDTTQGTRYLARTARLATDGVAAAALTAEVSALGTAWNPATREVTFGVEPGQGAVAAATQSLRAEGDEAAAAATTGFDVPQGYSQSGQSMVVTHWTGGSFEQPGEPALTVVSPNGRADYESYTRFYGWSAR
jgi:hypothetical protein